MASPLERGSAQWWRCYFRSSEEDIFGTVKKAFGVAAEDFQEELCKSSVGLVEALLSSISSDHARVYVATKVIRLCSSLLESMMENEKEGDPFKHINSSVDHQRVHAAGTTGASEIPSAVQAQQKQKSEDREPPCPLKIPVIRIKRSSIVKAPTTAPIDDPVAPNIEAAVFTGSCVPSALLSNNQNRVHNQRKGRVLIMQTLKVTTAGVGLPVDQETPAGVSTRCHKEPLLPATVENPDRHLQQVQPTTIPVASSAGDPDWPFAEWDTATVLKAVFGEDYDEQQELKIKLERSKRKLHEDYEKEIDRKRERKIQVIDARDLPTICETKKNVSVRHPKRSVASQNSRQRRGRF